MATEWICTACGASNIPGTRFCGQCGAPTAAADVVPIAIPQIREERRQITVLFSDASGYTRIVEHLDPEVVRDVMRRVYASAESIAVRYGGRVDKLMGDAVLVVFGDPVAHEDDAERAVRAAFELHAAVDTMQAELESRLGSSFRMHSGINSGVVVTGDLMGDRASGPLGDMVNVAARLQSLAGSGELLIGPETYALVKDRFTVTDLGERELKGRNRPVHVRRVEGIASAHRAPSRRVGAFIGRHEELGVLVGAVDRVRDGESSLITVCAEAGAGKTRLLEEVRRRLDDDVVWLEGRAYAYTTNIPYSPLIDLLNNAAGIDEGDKKEQVRSKLEAMVQRTLPGDDTAMVVLAHLYELTPSQATVDLEAFRSMLLTTLAALVNAAAKRAPTVVCLQDLHWVDPSTADLVRELTTVVTTPFVMICNFRPGFTLGANRERVLQLTELSGRQTREQLLSLLEGAELPAGLLDAVTTRSGGNPFFVEEIVNSLIETNVLVREANGWVLRRRLEELSLPSTIRGLIAARIDNLDPLQRRVLREVSVVGREFLYRLVRTVSNEPDDLDGSLNVLAAADLIREKSVDPELEYVFKHALTQEVAYEGLLRRDRQELHERVGRAIESQLGDRVDEFVETLAYHFQRSGQVVEAVGYLRRAGRKALERYAMVESHNHYRAAYEMLTGDDYDKPVDPLVRDRLLLETLVEWATAHYYTGEYNTLHELMTKHQHLPLDVGDDALRSRWLAWQGNVVWNHDTDINAAVALFDEALELGRKCGDVTSEAFAIAWLTWVLTTNGQSARAVALWPELNEILPKVPDPTDRRYAYIKGCSGAAIASACRGDTLRSRAQAQELIEFGARTGNRRASAMGHIVLIQVYLVLGDMAVVAKEAKSVVACEADPIYTWIGEIWTIAAAGTDDPDETTRQIELHRAEPAKNGFGAIIESYDVIATNARVIGGQVSRGLHHLASIRERVAARGNVSLCMNIDTFNAQLDSRLSCGGLTSSVLRNPGLLVHRRGAAKRGREALVALTTALEQNGFQGMRAEVEYELALLAKDQKRKHDARAHLQNVEDILRDEPYAYLRHHARTTLAEL